MIWPKRNYVLSCYKTVNTTKYRSRDNAHTTGSSRAVLAGALEVALLLLLCPQGLSGPKRPELTKTQKPEGDSRWLMYSFTVKNITDTQIRNAWHWNPQCSPHGISSPEKHHFHGWESCLGIMESKKEYQRKEVSSGIRWWTHPSFQMMSSSVALEICEV